MFNNLFFENRDVYEIMWKNVVEPDRPQMTIWHMRIARWIAKATNSHSEYVIPTGPHGNNGCRNAPQCYVICILSVSLYYPFI